MMTVRTTVNKAIAGRPFDRAKPNGTDNGVLIGHLNMFPKQIAASSEVGALPMQGGEHNLHDSWSK
jgi:hypothetical protein